MGQFPPDQFNFTDYLLRITERGRLSLPIRPTSVTSAFMEELSMVRSSFYYIRNLIFVDMRKLIEALSIRAEEDATFAAQIEPSFASAERDILLFIANADRQMSATLNGTAYTNATRECGWRSLAKRVTDIYWPYRKQIRHNQHHAWDINTFRTAWILMRVRIDIYHQLLYTMGTRLVFSQPSYSASTQKMYEHRMLLYSSGSIYLHLSCHKDAALAFNSNLADWLNSVNGFLQSLAAVYLGNRHLDDFQASDLEVSTCGGICECNCLRVICCCLAIVPAVMLTTVVATMLTLIRR